MHVIQTLAILVNIFVFAKNIVFIFVTSIYVLFLIHEL